MSYVAVKNQLKEENLVLTFKKGLPGLENIRSYALHALEGSPPLFYYLLSAEREEIGLILLDPFLAFPGYSVALSEAEVEELEVEREEDLLVLTTVNIKSDKEMTTNLAAPIVINIGKKTALQLVIPEKMEALRTPLPLA